MSINGGTSVVEVKVSGGVAPVIQELKDSGLVADPGLPVLGRELLRRSQQRIQIALEVRDPEEAQISVAARHRFALYEGDLAAALI